MSQRTLLEFNHDQSYKIDGHTEAFLNALGDLMRGGPTDHNLTVLKAYGVKWHGQRHHGDAFNIKWGGYSASEKSTP